MNVLLPQLIEVEVITFSTLCPSLLPMDANGRALRPIILHLDRRSYKQAQWALRRVGEEKFLDIAGNLPIPGGISATSLLCIRDHEPEIYAKQDVCFGHAATVIWETLHGRSRNTYLKLGPISSFINSGVAQSD